MTFEKTAPGVLVLIVTYNGMKWIDACLRAVAESTYPAVEILVVDNNSNDGTPDFIKENYPMVQLVAGNENQGFGKANNAGFRIALNNGADYVLLLNQDAYLEKETVERLVNCFDECNDDTGIISPLHLAVDHSPDFGFRNHMERYASVESQKNILQGRKGLYDVGFVNAACWMVSRKIIETVGGFNPIFPHYGEDVDFANRVRWNNYKIKVDSGSYIIHDRNQNQANIRANVDRQAIIFISLLTNINFSFFHSLFYFFWKAVKEVSYYIVTFRFGNARAVFLAFLKTLRILPKAVSSRGKSKRTGAFI